MFNFKDFNLRQKRNKKYWKKNEKVREKESKKNFNFFLTEKARKFFSSNIQYKLKEKKLDGERETKGEGEKSEEGERGLWGRKTLLKVKGRESSSFRFKLKVGSKWKKDSFQDPLSQKVLSSSFLFSLSLSSFLESSPSHCLTHFQSFKLLFFLPPLFNYSFLCLFPSIL